MGRLAGCVCLLLEQKAVSVVSCAGCEGGFVSRPLVHCMGREPWQALVVCRGRGRSRNTTYHVSWHGVEEHCGRVWLRGCASQPTCAGASTSEQVLSRRPTQQGLQHKAQQTPAHCALSMWCVVLLSGQGEGSSLGEGAPRGRQLMGPVGSTRQVTR
jgi:hypothetical protein